MKKFLVLYRTTVTARQQMASSTPEQAKAGMDAWMKWAQKAGPAIVDLGSPLGDAVMVGGQAQGEIGGFSVLQGESADAIKGILDGHPHLMMPGASIEIREYLPLPGM